MYSFQRHAPSEDGPTRPIRLIFPVLEHPDQRCEQAPVRMREMLYEAADEEAGIDYFQPLNIFWDEGNTDGRATAQLRPQQQFLHVLPEEEPETPQPRNSTATTRQSPRTTCLESSSNFILAMVVLIMCTVVAITIGQICSNGSCGGGSKDGGGVNNQQPIVGILDMPTPSPVFSRHPTMAPYLHVQVHFGQEEEEEESSNIFLRQPSPAPTLFPLINDISPTTYTNETNDDPTSDDDTSESQNEKPYPPGYTNGTTLPWWASNSTAALPVSATVYPDNSTTTTSPPTTSSPLTWIDVDTSTTAPAVSAGNTSNATENSNATSIIDSNLPFTSNNENRTTSVAVAPSWADVHTKVTKVEQQQQPKKKKKKQRLNS